MGKLGYGLIDIADFDGVLGSWQVPFPSYLRWVRISCNLLVEKLFSLMNYHSYLIHNTFCMFQNGIILFIPFHFMWSLKMLGAAFNPHSTLVHWTNPFVVAIFLICLLLLLLEITSCPIIIFQFFRSHVPWQICHVPPTTFNWTFAVAPLVLFLLKSESNK